MKKQFRPQRFRFAMGAAVLFFFYVVPPTARADTTVGISLSSVSEVATRVAQAHETILSAYVLSPRGRMAAALRRAASHGAHVHVVLDGVAQGSVFGENLRHAASLRADGIRVDLTRLPLHAKAAVVDSTVYLTDRNWASNSRSEIVLRDDDAGDKAIVLRAMLGQSGGNAHFSTRKRDALALEAQAIAQSQAVGIDVETEAYTVGTSVEAEMLRSAAAGHHVRFLVAVREYAHSGREQRALARLRQHGIDARVTRASEKMAVSGSVAWVGSANATPGVPDQIDWGMRLPQGLAATVESAFARNWNRARIE